MGTNNEWSSSGRKLDFGFRGPICPIDNLRQELKRWEIKATVQKKFPERKSLLLADYSGEIRAVVFDDNQWDKMEEKKSYYISNADLHEANKLYTNVGHDYEMMIGMFAKIEACEEEESITPPLRFNFQTLSSVMHLEPDTIIDIIGVCSSIGYTKDVESVKDNKILTLITIKLVDASEILVDLEVWEEEIEKICNLGNKIPFPVAVKTARVVEWQGIKKVSMLKESILVVNPDIPEAHKLMSWYDQFTT